MQALLERLRGMIAGLARLTGRGGDAAYRGDTGDEMQSALAPWAIVAMVAAGPVLVGVMIGYLLIGLAYDDEVGIHGPPPLPSEWLEDDKPEGPAGGEAAPGFGKAL
jgi:hypothetical protein